MIGIMPVTSYACTYGKCSHRCGDWGFTDIEAVPFNRGFYSVDLKYFFKITLDVFTGVGKPCKTEGLATFDKKVILFGSEGNAKVFSSSYRGGGIDPQDWQKTNMPKAIIEVVEPIALSCKVVEPNDNCCCCCDETDLSSIPTDVCGIFEDNLVSSGDDRRVFVTIGVFSIVKLERSVQLLIPAYDFCVPNKDCVTATDENPCDLFERIEFPVDEFFPPGRRSTATAPQAAAAGVTTKHSVSKIKGTAAPYLFAL